jgi:2-polyprenyl-6-methoxyphenol hydroxylase-like FAD-dependent oxidoreductase
LTIRGPHRRDPRASERAHPDTGVPAQRRIAVVGGSLTGPATALLLAQAGFADVRLYEATPASAPLGGGLISLEHAALAVLDQLRIGRDEYIHVPSETIWHTPVHRRVLGEPLRRTYPGGFTTWTQLNRALAIRLPYGMALTGARVVGITEHRRRPLLHFADGRTDTADLVVFADGRASTGRELLDPGRPLQYAGYVGHRGTAADNPTGIVDFWRLEPGPGVQFNIAPVPGGCDWTFYLNATTAEYVDWFGANPRRRLFAHTRHVNDTARAHVNLHAAAFLPEPYAGLVEHTTDRSAFPVMDIAPPTRMVWSVGDGYAVLLGDALAPVRAHTARGANNGLEQAAGLVAALRDQRQHGGHVSTALAGWERQHLPSAVAAVRLGPIIGARLGLGTVTKTDDAHATTAHQPALVTA